MENEPRWRRYLRFHRAEPSADFDDEVRDHLQSTIESLIARGRTPEEARAEAHRRFGDIEAVRAAVTMIDQRAARSGDRLEWVRAIARDTQYTVRQLARAPLFAAVAAISIGLGVALNVTIFSVANGMLLRSLPGVNAAGLVRVYVNRHGAFQWQDLSWIRDRATALESLIGERMAPMPMELGGSPERVIGAYVTRGYFGTLGVRMALGRAFDVDERQPGEAPVVLSHAAWQRRFGGDSSIVGRAIRIAGHPFTVVGVASPEFISSVFAWAPEAWVPLAAAPFITGSPVERLGGSFYAIARLDPTLGRAAAETQLAALAAERLAMDPTRFREYTIRLDHVRGVNAELRAPVGVASGFLLAMVVLVLVIACANVANLLLARSAARRAEIGVRIALGASRGRLVRQLLTESMVLSLVGAGLGLAVAYNLVRIVARMIPSEAGLFVDVSPDGQVLAYAALLCIGSAMLFGLVPALRASSPSVTELLRGNRDAIPWGRSRLRGALVGGQVALCVLVLAVASLLVRSFVRSRTVDPGFVAAGVLDLQLDVGEQRDAEAGRALFDRITQRLTATPGVQGVALADLVPLSGNNSETRVAPEGFADTDDGALPRTYFNVVSPGYFAALRLPIVRGREFLGSDGPSAPKVVVINETAARRWWPNGEAIGRRVRFGGADGTEMEVVGVARDAKYNSYGEDPTAFTYLPFAQHYRPVMVAHVRLTNPTPSSAQVLRDAVRSVDPTLPPPAVKSLSAEIAFALLPARIGAGLLSAFGLVALLIAASGIYGVTSYAVARRTREIGIRSALGATRGRVLRLIVGEGMRTVAIGAAAGLTMALLASAALTRVLYGVTPLEPLMLVGVPGVLSAVALMACWIPARRAARIDPVRAMRAE